MRRSILAVIFLIVGCAGMSQKQSRHADWDTLPNEATLKKAMTQLDAWHMKRRSLRSQIKMAAPFLSGKTAHDAAVVAQPTLVLRMDLMDPVGGVVASLDVHGDWLKMYIPKDNRMIEADLSGGDVFQRLSKLPWTLPELFALLQGMPPLKLGEDMREWAIGPDGVAVSGEGDMVMGISPDTLLPQRAIRYTSDFHNRMLYEVEFDDYVPTSIGMYPRHMTVTFPKSNTTVEWWVETIEWNPTVAWGALTIDVPDGTKIVQIQ